MPSAIGKSVHRRLVQRRIVEAGGPKREDVGHSLQFRHHRASADHTKTALDCPASITNRLVIARFALDADGCFGNHQVSGIAAAACPLTVAAVTIQHDYGSSIGLISDRATAGATARDGLARDLILAFCMIV